MADYIKIGIEDVSGANEYGSGVSITTGTGAEAGLKATSVGEDVDRGVTYEETIDAFMKNSGHAGALMASGNLECMFRPLQMKGLLYAFLGVETSDTYTFGPHPKSMVFRVGDITAGANGKERVFSGVGIKSFNLAMEAKEYVKATIDWLARDYADSPYGTATYTQEAPVVFWRANVVIDGSLTVPIKGMNLNMDGKIADDEFVLGDFRLRRLVRNGVVELTGDMTFSETDYEEIARAIYGSTSATSVSTLNPLANIEVSIKLSDLAGNLIMTITMPQVIYGKATNSRSGRDMVEKKVDFEVVNGISFVYE